MKRALLLALLISSLIPSLNSIAEAATKPVSVKELAKVVAAPGAEGLVTTGTSLVTYSNLQGATADVMVSAYSFTGAALWQNKIDAGIDEVATAITTDPSGNIWIAGTSATPVVADTSTALVGIDNPDGVVVEQKSAPRALLNRVTLWKISPTGELLSTLSQAVDATPLINAISVNSSGSSVIGVLSNKAFLLSVNTSGTFSNVIFIGSGKSEITSLVRNTDGTINLFGSSTETLAGKKLVGIRDGVLIKVGKSGAITSVVRSSAPKAERRWLSADSSLLLSGTVQTGKIVETALTKFAPTFNPIWTTRVASQGISMAVTAGASSYLAISSKSPIAGVSGWKPAAPQLLLLSYSSKGVLDGAWSSGAFSAPISLAYSKMGGLFGLAIEGDQSVSIFHLTSR